MTPSPQPPNPPDLVSHQQAGASGSFRAPTKRRSWTVGLFAANAGLELLSIGPMLMTLSLIAAVRAEEEVTEESTNLIDLLSALIGLSFIAVYIAAIVVFCCWFYRINANAAMIADEKPPMSPGMAVGSFFIPFLNLWRPYQAAAFAWKSSARLACTDRPKPPSHALVGAWWFAWLGSGIFAQVVFRMEFGIKEPTLEQVENIQHLSIASAVAGMISAGLAIALVLRLTGFQSRVAAKIEAPALAPGRDA